MGNFKSTCMSKWRNKLNIFFTSSFQFISTQLNSKELRWVLGIIIITWGKTLHLLEALPWIRYRTEVELKWLRPCEQMLISSATSNTQLAWHRATNKSQTFPFECSRRIVPFMSHLSTECVIRVFALPVMGHLVCSTVWSSSSGRPRALIRTAISEIDMHKHTMKIIQLIYSAL